MRVSRIARVAGRLRALVVPLAALASGGCGMVVLDPAGDVARQQATLIMVSTGLMLLIILPVMALTALFAWRYRASNTAAPYEPDWDHSTGLELIIWAAPLLIIIALGAIAWISTHTLDPYRPLRRIAPGKPIAAAARPLEIGVVALDWKWLFIYPAQGVATVNLLVLPVDRPVRFRITSSSVMNSFYVPALAGQIYAMPGMETTLHAVLNRPGHYGGFSANYSGAGFSDMHFAVEGVDAAGFDRWAAGVRGGHGLLDAPAYLRLERPSEKVPPLLFASVAPRLFDRVSNMCVRPGQTCIADTMRRDMAHGGVLRHQPPTDDTAQPRPGAPRGALLKSPREKGSAPHFTQPRGPAGGNRTPGKDANRNMTLLVPPPAVFPPIGARRDGLA